MAEVPERLGKYHILELIAQGGMAEVYKAKTVGIAGFEKVLALKRIRPRYASEDRFIRNFIDEARIAVTLNHRNIVQVFDFGKAEGELYLAMELLEGVDLRMALKAARDKGENLPAALACYIMSDVASGLDYAHRKCDSEGNPLGIVHCDVSPHNVLLSNEGFVKILDFGVARARFIAAPTSKRLRGKPRYMAPEQTLGETPSSASDVFVVGILAWELLAGRKLFDGGELREILEAVRQSEVENLGEIRPELPDYLVSAVMRALDRDPKNRGSAADIGIQMARAGREMSDTTSAQALSEWLRETFAGEFQAEETKTDLQPRPLMVAADLISEATETRPRVAMMVDKETGDVPEDTAPTVDGLGVGTTPPLSVLLDKRRVVVTILLLEGGTEDRRRELSLAFSDLAYKRGAVVHERLNNEVVAIFGLQVAGEDDVANAMHFATDAAELARNTSDHEPGHREADPITLRSASRAGVVAQRRESEYQLRGDALQEARELARGAEPNRPLLSGGTGRMASAQFLFRELPARRYRSRRLRVLELVGPSGHDDRTRALRSRPGRFVGRREELELLWSAFERSMSGGSGEVVVIDGAAGVGKSRLVAEFVARLDDSGVSPLLVAISATEAAAAAPFTLAIEYMQAGLKLAPARGELARTDLVQRMASALRDGAADEKLIRATCRSIELAMELRDGALSRNEEAPAGLRERCAEAIGRFHTRLAGSRPSVLVLENFHLSDAASLEILQTLLRNPGCTHSSLVLMTSKDERLVESFPGAACISLVDLDGEAREELIDYRLADSRTDEVALEVSRRAGGNPLYIEELCRTIREVGWDETPATVRDTVVARVDRLSGRSRAVLQRAAVIGESFRAHILEELIAAPAATHLQELIDDSLLVRSDEAEYEAEGGEFSFRHGLIQEVVYASLSAGARKATHANLGKLLAMRDEAGRDEPPALTARHLELGGQLLDAAYYWTKAGRIALAAFEVLSARDSFARAIAIHRKLEPSEREESADQHVEALFGHARALRDLGDYDAQGQDLLELEPLCQHKPSDKAELLAQMAERHLRNGAFERALEEAERAVAAAQQAGTPLIEGEALRVTGEALERTGKYEEGLEATNLALSIFEQLGARGPETRARISMARSHLVRSRYAEARGIYQPILVEVRRNRDPWIERIANNHLAVIHLCLGEFEDAMRCAQASVRLCEVDGDQARAGDNLSVCGIILSEVGQYTLAQEHFERALALHELTKSRWSRADCMVYAGFNTGMLGDYATAIAHLQQALDEAEELGTPYIQSNAGIALAGLYLHRGAEQDLERAVEVAELAAGVAREATLSGAEAMALSRQGAALRRLGEIDRGLEASNAALKILDRQRHLEGSEEEILYHHHLLLEAAGRSTAARYLDRANQGFERKLKGISDRDWRRSYCEDVAINAAILVAAQEETA